MKHFSCGDVVPGCQATFTGSTDDDVMQQVVAHAEEDHGMSSLPPETQEQVKASIH
ncbi:hypothetical protein BH24ACT15_BH24ACT15_27140 [soil metagenome]